MGRFFISAEAVSNGTVTVEGADAAHIFLSLRMKPKDAITFCDENSTEYSCVITAASKDRVTSQIISTNTNSTELDVKVHLYLSLSKGDKFESVIQKAVELGVYSITPVISLYCVSRPDEKSLEKKLVRWQTIAREAAKQCGRGIIPKICSVLTLRQALDSLSADTLRLFCYETGDTESIKSYLKGAENIAVFTGPEGGYSAEEAKAAKNAGCILTNLGKRILRCETAPLFALACIVYEYEL